MLELSENLSCVVMCYDDHIRSKTFMLRVRKLSISSHLLCNFQLTCYNKPRTHFISENPTDNNLLLLSPIFMNWLREAAAFCIAKHKIGKSFFHLSLYLWVWPWITHQVLCLFALCQSTSKCEAGYLHISFVTHSFT